MAVREEVALKVTETSEVQSQKALDPIEITDEGMATEARELQPWKEL